MIENNPYKVGSAIEDPESFFGRDEIFNFIEENLNQKAQVILLNGQRRIGKSSILKQISNNSDKIKSKKYIFIYFDLQNKTQISVNKILNYLTEEIVDSLERKLDFLKSKELQKEYDEIQDRNINANIFCDSILPTIFEKLDNKKLVLLFDEFDILDENDSSQKPHDFFYCLKSILEKHRQIVIIPVLGKRPEELPKFSSLFKNALYHEIGLLDERSARNLIIEPGEKKGLEYEKDAVERILQLSSCHPFFIQAICYELFAQEKKENIRYVTKAEVEMIIDKVIDSISGGLAWYRDGLPVAERIVFKAIADCQNLSSSNADNKLKDPFTLLTEHGVKITPSIHQAVSNLKKWDFINSVESKNTSDKTSNTYQIQIELVFHWLVKRHTLKTDIKELENIDSTSNKIYKEAINLPSQQQEIAKSLYEQILLLNPNHFKSLFELSIINLNRKNFKKAVELYERAYKVDSFRNEDGYKQSLVEYADHLVTEKKFDEAISVYHKLYDLYEDDDLEKKKTEVQLKFIDKQKKDSLVEYADHLVTEKKFDEAVSVCKKLYDLCENDDLEKKKIEIKLKSIIKQKNSSIIEYANYLVTKRKFDEAISVCKKLYDLCENDDLERKKIEIKLKSIARQKKDIAQKIHYFIRFKLSSGNKLAVSTLFTLLCMTIFFYSTRKNCNDDQVSKGDICIYTDKEWYPNIYSRGEQPLFNDVNNIYRSRGIEAFKDKNFSQAEDFFEKAIVANRNDPEVLIFYNNSKANNKASQISSDIKLITLAVIVPMDKSENDVQEVLRGVAQAQHEVNNSERLNDKLLEIIIIHDISDNEDYAGQKVAEKIVKDSTIVGIIAYDTSLLSPEAINKYEDDDLAIISLTDLSFTDTNNNLFLMSSSQEELGKEIARYVNEELKKEKVVVYFSDNSEYSKNLKVSFENHFKSLEGKTIRDIDISQPSFDAEGEVLKNKSSDKVSIALLFPDSEHISVATEIIKQNAKLHQENKLMLIGNEMLYSQSNLIASGDDIIGLTLAVPWFAKFESLDESSSLDKDSFPIRSVRLWGGNINWRTAVSFDATQTFIHSFSKVRNIERTSILKEFKKDQFEVPSNETSGRSIRFNNQERSIDPIFVDVSYQDLTQLRFKLIQNE